MGRLIAIKDFEMPSCCGECQMASCKGLNGHFYCDITTHDVDMDDTERDADCPLLEAIPKVEYEARLRLKAEREKIAHEVSEKMYYMKSCPNERNIIVGVITGHRETYESLCPTCENTDCVINKSLIPGEDVINMLAEILDACVELKEDKTNCICIDDVIQMIQEEISKLKGNTNGF